MAKTDELPGVEGEGVTPKKIKRLDNAIEAWRATVDRRMKLTESEVKERDKVVSIMHEEGLTKYPYWVSDEEQKVLVLEANEKLKLKKAEANEVEDLDIEDD